MKVTVPLVVVMTGVAVVVLTRFIRSEVSDIAPATRMLNLRVSELGPMSGRERRLAAVMLVTIVCWIVLGSRVNIAVIAVLSAVTLSVFRIVNWQEIQEYVNWGVVVMYGGAVAVGAALKDTHAMLWLVQQVLPSGGASPLLLLILMAALAIGLSAVISNAAAVAVLLPVGFALCGACQPAVHPMAMTYTVAIASGMAFVLPISSPPHAICFASGYYSMKEVPKYGIPITFLALLGMIGLITLYWPLIGTSITVQ